MAITPELKPIFDPGDDLKHPNEVILGPLFSVLYSTKEKIAPWLEPTFWTNMLNKEFADRYFQELFKNISNIGPNDANADSMISLFITTILHIVFSFHKGFPKESIKSYYDKMLTLQKKEISMMLLYLEKYSAPIDLPNMLNRIITSESSLSVDYVIPLFTYNGLQHLLRNSLEYQNSFLMALIDRSTKSMSQNVTLMLHHMVNVFNVFCPDCDRKGLIQLHANLLRYMSLASPISDIASETTDKLKKSINYPGYAFYCQLYQMAQLSEAFSGQVPLFFDSSSTLVSTLLYNDTVDRASFSTAYLQYARYFIHRFLGAMPPQNTSDLERFMQNLKFSKKYLSTMVSDYKLVKADPRYIRPRNTLPQYMYQLFRLPTSFSLTPEMNEPFSGKAMLISSPAEAILKQSFFTPLLNYFTNNPNSQEQSILLIGNDYLLSTLMSTLTIFILKNPALLNVEFTFYFIPMENSQIGDYFAENDHIYKVFVRNLYLTATSILPNYDENSKAFFPSFVASDEMAAKYESSIFSSVPSPSHIFQHGLQHYLHFATRKTDIYIWQCILHLSGKYVTVPFVGSVVVDMSENPKRTFEMSIMDYGKKTATNEIVETKVLSLYNASVEKHAKPNKDFIILDTGFARMIYSAKIETPKAKPLPFVVYIDDRKYGPLNAISVMYMPTVPGKSSDPMRMKIKTFVDIY